MAQKEKDREKERDQFLARSSSVGLKGLRAAEPENHLSRSLSRDRNNQDPPNKTYITISTGKPTRIRESSPTKKSSENGDTVVRQDSGYHTPDIPDTNSETNETTAERRTSDEILNKYCSPLKSTEIFKDITGNDQKKPPSKKKKKKKKKKS